MPTYEYECKKCGHKFDAFQSITEASLTACPLCAGKVQKLISAGAGFIFKGSGFYATDYRSKEYKDKQKQETGCPAVSGDKSACPGCSLNKKDE